MNQHAARSALRIFAVGLAVFIACLADAKAAPQVVWQVGDFDHSSGEFNNAKPGPPFFGDRYPKELLYIVGKSTPANDWPARHLGSAIFSPGAHPRPYTIQFDLDEMPQGVYTLRIGLLNEIATVGQLQIAINGHVGFFYQHPKLSYTGGDRSMVVSPTASEDTVVADLPAKFLRKGVNKLVLTAVDEPSEAVGDVHSMLVYDALELVHDATRKFAADEMSAEVVPTVFYVRREAGLAEIVDVFVQHNAAIQRGQISLSAAGQTLSEEMAATGFGEHREEFSVPEFPAGTRAVVTVKADGHARRFPIELTPARKWNLLVVPHVHVDVGYSDYQEKVAEIQSRELDEAIEFIHQHPAFRFSPDGFWSARQYLAGRSQARQQQLFQMVRDKKIFIPTVEASLLTGFPSLETLIRSLYPAFAFHQKYGGDANYANITDVPSYSWSYASVMAAAGLQYFASGCDNDNGPILLYNHLNEQSPFWWVGPDGGKILMWYSWVYSQLSYLFGGYQGRVATGRESMATFLSAYSRPEYKSDSVLVYGSQSENTDLFPRQAEVVDDWNKLYAYPHLEYSGFADAIRTIAQPFGDSIPTVRGDGGPYWEYGIESTARSAAVDRESEQRASAAEIFSTLGGLVNPSLRTDPAILQRLWNSMVLYAEHTWGADRSVSDPHSQETVDQLAVKEAFATDAQRDVNYVLRRGLAGLADSITEPKGTLLVFNPLSWQRSSLVEMDLDKGRDLINLVTHQSVPYEVLSTGEAYRRVRFLAQDVPPVGYKAYEMKPTKEEPPAPTVLTGEAIENQYYRVALDAASGSVRSIFDKELNRELVNASSPYRFDQYVYVTGGDKSPNRLQEYSSAATIPELTPHGAGGGRIVSITPEPFGQVARLESSGVNTPRIQTEVILFDSQKKIGLINRVNKKEVYTKEGVYFAFPLAMDQPQFRYEIQNGYVDPERDQIPGAGKEWFSVQHWVAADQNGVTAALVPVDAPLATLGDIIRGTWPREFGRRNGTIFSAVMNNYYFTNYAAGQGGDFMFRYAFTSGKNVAPGYLSRVGREEMSPLEIDQITPQDKAINVPRPLAAGQGSFLNIDQPDVVLVTWKNAEDGDGTVLRFLEVAGKSVEANVAIPLLDVKTAWMADALERKQAPLTTTAHGFRLSVKPFQIVTVRLEGAEGSRQ